MRDPDTGDSLNYGFVEFETKEAAQEAYFKMNNSLIDDRRVKVDFSQSVAKLWKTRRNPGRDRRVEGGRGGRGGPGRGGQFGGRGGRGGRGGGPLRLGGYKDPTWTPPNGGTNREKGSGDASAKKRSRYDSSSESDDSSSKSARKKSKKHKKEKKKTKKEKKKRKKHKKEKIIK